MDSDADETPIFETLSAENRALLERLDKQGGVIGWDEFLLQKINLLVDILLAFLPIDEDDFSLIWETRINQMLRHALGEGAPEPPEGTDD